MALVPNLLLFGRVLRAAGVHVHRERMVDAIQATEWIGMKSRADLRATLCALLVHRHEDLTVFNEAFDLFFRAHGSSELDMPLFSLGERARVVTRRDAGAPHRLDVEEPASDADASAAFALGAYSTVEVSRTKDFADFTAGELEEARRLLMRLRWEPGIRRTRRWQRALRGDIDMPRLLRRNVMRGGELIELPRRVRRTAPRPIVLLADVSGSMDRYSRMLLSFASGLTRSARHVESFVFATRLTRVSRWVAAAGGHRVVSRMVRDLHDWGGGTRIGEALRSFNTTWARRVMRHGPVVLIVSDGWDRGDPELLARELARVRRRCSRLIWLNPLLGSASYQPLTRGMQAALAHIDDFMPVHNLDSLEDLARQLRHGDT
ncbi:MAG TPA: VWA domain-containing protein [Vicinamibacterales bacterium]